MMDPGNAVSMRRFSCSTPAPDAPLLTGDNAGTALLEPAPLGSLPILGQLHLLMIRANQQKRETDRKAEEKFEAEESAADVQRIQEMRDKADKALCVGLLSASLQVANAVASTAATSRELSALDKSEQALKRAETMTKFI